MKKLAMFAVVAVLSACSAKSGEQFVGNYEATYRGQRVLVSVERNDDTFIFKRTASLNGQPRTFAVPATYKDGILQVQEQNGTKTAVSYIKDRDALLLDAHEFRRVH